ncbi:MAG: sigma-70 family RNA polymerase sigma factor [Gemmatimonadota bacterium]|nr:MAG: sigma-70 family RNA polymerase sigma factor [Gemmatimonadota bacterium]
MSEEADHMTLTDELVRKARTGDRQAFERLIRLHFGRIHRWALIGTGDPDDADDVTQRVLILVHRKLHSFRGEAGFESWLYRITRNVVGELFRKRKSRTRTMDHYEASGVEAKMTEAEEKGPTDRIAAVQAASLIKTFFEALPTRQREVFDLVELQGRKPGDVAELLGLEASTVRVHLLRARRTIRSRVLEQHPEFAEDYR